VVLGEIGLAGGFVGRYWWVQAGLILGVGLVGGAGGGGGGGGG
jgi:hypothetical protein